MSANYPTKVILAFRSGDRCAFKACPLRLSVEGHKAADVIVGEAAHIYGEKPGAARYLDSMSDEERNECSNLVYMCPSHHTIIDKQEDDYPAHDLFKLKEEHEQKVREAMEEAFAEVGFQELALATEWITKQPVVPLITNFSVIPPEDKIVKNHLSSASRSIIVMGLSVAPQVKQFIEQEAMNDNLFPERLRAGFLSEYYKYKREGHNGDELFELMCAYAQRGFKEQARRSAGLAVLSYLFEICEVFEK